MKKFFQSEMFIDVHQKETIKKLTEPLAVGGALVAASLAAFLEQMSHRNWVGVAGFGGLMVGVAGVALYVFKDRMKDQARTFFTAKLGRILPDLEREIRTDGQVIGSVREWFGYKKATDAPESVKQFRNRACVSEAEKFLPEDIFYFRRQFEIRNSESCGLKVKRSLQENLRINVHRHLKHMDDVTKSFRVLDSEGQFSNLESHRVYHIHAVLLSSLKTTVKSKNPIKNVASRSAHHDHVPDHMEVYRIVLDKNGVDRVEPLF